MFDNQNIKFLSNFKVNFAYFGCNTIILIKEYLPSF